MLAFSIATGALAMYAFTNWAWPWVVVITYLHCSFYGYFGGGTGGHELSHRTVFASKWLNELFIVINGFFTYFDFITFHRSHTGHHQYTVHQDLDLEVMLPAKFVWHGWISSFTINPVGVWNIFKSLFRLSFFRSRDKVLVTEWNKRCFPESDRRAIRAMQNWNRVLLFGHLALLVLFIVSGNWMLILLVTLAPFTARWFGVLTHAPQHLGMKPDVADWRQSTRTYLAGPIVRFFYWNMNYHVEHHMFAAVPYYNLPELRRVIAGDLPVATKGLFATWREIAGTLKHRKKVPGYHFSPPLPNGATPYL